MGGGSPETNFQLNRTTIMSKKKKFVEETLKELKKEQNNAKEETDSN